MNSVSIVRLRLEEQVDAALTRGLLAGFSEDEISRCLDHRDRIRTVPVLGEGHSGEVIPELLVVRDSGCPLANLVRSIEIGGKRIQTYLCVSEIVPVSGIELPTERLYPVFNVSFEQFRSRKDLRAQLGAGRRRGFTVEEGLPVLVRHPEIVDGHRALILAASQCGTESRSLPILYFEGDIPVLGCTDEMFNRNWEVILCDRS